MNVYFYVLDGCIFSNFSMHFRNFKKNKCKENLNLQQASSINFSDTGNLMTKNVFFLLSQVVLNAGDILYIPQHWWHHVRSFECPNIAISLWFHPFAEKEEVSLDEEEEVRHQNQSMDKNNFLILLNLLSGIIYVFRDDLVEMFLLQLLLSLQTQHLFQELSIIFQNVIYIYIIYDYKFCIYFRIYVKPVFIFATFSKISLKLQV